MTLAIFSKQSPSKRSTKITIGIISGLVLLAVGTMTGHGNAAGTSFKLLNGQPQVGTIVSLTSNPGIIEPSNLANAKSLLGVIAPHEATIDQQSPDQINVKTDGVASAFVSTLNGDIVVGDRITASPIQGVGQKATSNSWIVGIAQSSLDAKTKGAVKSTVTDSKGGKRTVYVGSTAVLIKITYYTADSSTSSTVKTTVPNGLQRLADYIAGKHVTVLALLLSFALFTMGVVAAAIVVNGSIKGGFTAISRQPLAKRTILREVWRSFGIALLILLFVMAAAALLLRVL